MAPPLHYPAGCIIISSFHSRTGMEYLVICLQRLTEMHSGTFILETYWLCITQLFFSLLAFRLFVIFYAIIKALHIGIKLGSVYMRNILICNKPVCSSVVINSCLTAVFELYVNSVFTQVYKKLTFFIISLSAT